MLKSNKQNILQGSSRENIWNCWLLLWSLAEEQLAGGPEAACHNADCSLRGVPVTGFSCSVTQQAFSRSWGYYAILYNGTCLAPWEDPPHVTILCLSRTPFTRSHSLSSWCCPGTLLPSSSISTFLSISLLFVYSCCGTWFSKDLNKISTGPRTDICQISSSDGDESHCSLY